MAKYQVSIIEFPPQWEPQRADDVPAQPGTPLEVLATEEEIFDAVKKAIDFNETARREKSPRWAVVVEPGCLGQTWAGARLCTPLVYKVTAIWWPAGWEPQSPLDVPNCVWKAQGESDHEEMDYPQALATVRALNRQSLDQAGTMWYVVIAVENEPISRSVSYDPSGTETTVAIRRLHVVRSEEGGKGDCSLCPASSFDCAKEDWVELEQLMTDRHSREAS